ENVGGIATWLLCTLLIACAAILWMKRGSATPLHIIPQWNWATVNSWATIAFAMTGLEVVGMMGGEIRDPERTIPRAGWIASICASAFYSVTTLALLVLLRPEN